MQTMYEKEITSVSPVSRRSRSGDDPQFQIEPIDPAAEKKLLWKCDIHVLPPITLLFMLAFIDRINIGNARIQGMEKDLNMTGQDYNIALCVFFLLYITCEVPSNLLLRKIAPSTWLSLIMVCWGTMNLLIESAGIQLIYGPRNHYCMHGPYQKFLRPCCMQAPPGLV